MKEKKTSSSLARILVNCGAQAKVYGSCVAAKVPQIERDMCVKEFLALKNCMQTVVVSWKINPFTSEVAATTDTISEGPIVLSVRYSLDSKLIAVQRSNREVQFWIKETGETFSQKSKSDSDSILGGLDLYTYAPELKSLELIETKKMNVSWYIYTHESRLVLLASGMQCKSFTGYQLSSAGVIRLPRFEMTMAKADVNSKPVLAAEDVHIVTVYGRIYCLQVDRVAMLLHSYRFYRDAVIQQAILASSSEVPSVLEFLQRRKLEAKKEVAASEFSHLNHSLSHRPVSVKPDISKPDISKASSAGGKLHILKPSCERNGITPTPKESLSPTSGSKVPNSPLTGESNLLIVKASAD
ncbi:regulator of MON1-CCZ1 complex [Tanacetum coccineum]